MPNETIILGCDDRLILEAKQSDQLPAGILKQLAGPFAYMNVTNSNRRIYLFEDYDRVCRPLLPMIEQARLFGECEHVRRNYVPMDARSHRIDSFSWNEDQTIASGVISLLNTVRGQIPYAISEANSPIFTSSRATGAPKLRPDGSVPLGKMITWDVVGDPGFDGEYASLMVPINESKTIAMFDEQGFKEKDFSQLEQMLGQWLDTEGKAFITEQKLKPMIEEIIHAALPQLISMHQITEGKLTGEAVGLFTDLQLQQIVEHVTPAVSEKVFAVTSDWFESEAMPAVEAKQQEVVATVDAWHQNEVQPWLERREAKLVKTQSNWIEEHLLPKLAEDQLVAIKTIDQWTESKLLPMINSWATTEVVPHMQNNIDKAVMFTESWISSEFLPMINTWIEEHALPHSQERAAEQLLATVNSYLESKGQDTIGLDRIANRFWHESSAEAATPDADHPLLLEMADDAISFVNDMVPNAQCIELTAEQVDKIMSAVQIKAAKQWGNTNCKQISLGGEADAVLCHIGLDQYLLCASDDFAELSGLANTGGADKGSEINEAKLHTLTSRVQGFILEANSQQQTSSLAAKKGRAIANMPSNVKQVWQQLSADQQAQVMQRAATWQLESQHDIDRFWQETDWQAIWEMGQPIPIDQEAANAATKKRLLSIIKGH